MHEVERFEHCGVDVRIYADEDAGNPYDNMDQASRIMGFDQLHRQGFAEERFPVDEERELPVLARWLTLFGGEAVAIPFVFSDYGSGGMRAYLTDVDNDRAAGFVVVSRETVEKEWPESTTIDGETFTALQMAERVARAEFETWASWLEGDVYGYVVAKGTPEGDSCWGFYGPGDEYVKQEARGIAEDAAFDAEKRRLTRRMYLLDPEARPQDLSFGSFLLEQAGEEREVRATFRYYGGGTESLRERTGERVTVLRRLGLDEADAEVGPMYSVRFPDGRVADVFEEELTYLHTAEREREEAAA